MNSTPHDLTPLQRRIYDHLRSADFRRATASEIADALGARPASVRQVLGALYTRGLVQRQQPLRTVRTSTAWEWRAR